MKKFLYTLLFTATASLPLSAQSLKDFFLQMPQEVCPVLSEYNRLEIVDNQKNGKPMQTRNLLSTFSTMEELTDDYARLAVSTFSTKEMKMLPLNDGRHILMVISTVRADSIYDSSVAFYNTSWQPLSATDYLDKPTSDTFRTIKTSPTLHQLTVVTSQPITLRTDGSSQPTAVTHETQVFVWNTELNRFCQKKE